MTALEFHPLTERRWPDLVALFGPRGACGGCWCMSARLTAGEFRRGLGATNRRRMRRLVVGGPPPGILAYAEGAPIGWCALAPREDYARLEGSRVLARVDDKPVWSVVCFFIAKAWRGRGLSARLLREAARFAAGRGARLLEGYPLDIGSQRLPPPFVWQGLAGAFRDAGFREVARRSRTRPIMRKALRPPRSLGARARRAGSARSARG